MPQSDRLIELREGHIDSRDNGSPHEAKVGIGLSAISPQPDGSVGVLHLDVAGDEDMVPFSVGIDLDANAIATLVTGLQTVLLMQSPQPPPGRDWMN